MYTQVRVVAAQEVDDLREAAEARLVGRGWLLYIYIYTLYIYIYIYILIYTYTYI